MYLLFTKKVKSLKYKLKTKMFGRKTFEFFQNFGIHIMPDFFYSSIPNINKLKKSCSWKKPYSLIGINGVDLEKQLEFVANCCSDNIRKILSSKDIFSISCQDNEFGFGQIEADFLYCFISSFKPNRVVQIGCGVSTKTMLLAANDSNHNIEITCIDPYPTSYLLEQYEAQKIKLIAEEAQEINIEIITNLEEGDLLFVDSTHTVKPGSEVNKIILEVLPRLKKGVFVHFHDIYFPYDYHPEILSKQIYFWNESILLQAYLTNNPKYEIKTSMSMLHHFKSKELQQLLPNYDPHQRPDFGLFNITLDKHFPASTYIQAIK